MKRFLFCAALAGALLCVSPVVAKPAKKAASSAAKSAAALPGGARVFVKYSLAYYPRFTTNFDHLLLFPGGVAFDDIPTKPIAQWNVATLRKTLDARDAGSWKMSGNALSLSFPRGNRTLKKHKFGWFDGKGAPPADSAYDIYYPVTAPPRAKLPGAWQFSSLIVMGTNGGGAPMVAAGTSGNWVFNADGTFRDGSESFTSATTTNMGEAYKGDGDVTSTGTRRQSSSGKWNLNGALLTLEKDGQRTVHLAFLMPHWTKNQNNTDLMIDGDRWKRPERK